VGECILNVVLKSLGTFWTFSEQSSRSRDSLIRVTLGNPGRGVSRWFCFENSSWKIFFLTLFRQRLEQHFSFSMILAFRPRGACTPGSVECKRQLKAAARLAKHWQKGILTRHVWSKDRKALVTLWSAQPDLIAYCQARAHTHAHTHTHTHHTTHIHCSTYKERVLREKGGCWEENWWVSFEKMNLYCWYSRFDDVKILTIADWQSQSHSSHVGYIFLTQNQSENTYFPPPTTAPHLEARYGCWTKYSQ